MSNTNYWKQQWDAVTDTVEVLSSPEPENKTIGSKKWDYDKIKEFYNSDGQSILRQEYNAGKIEDRKERWKDLYGKNTCAIKLSYALNNAGYIIQEHKTKNNRLTWSGNINSRHQYILSADEMGAYLKTQLGSPTFKSNGPITSDESLETFVNEVTKWKNYGGIIFLDSKNHKEYQATGHVDLIYEDWGSDPYIYDRGQELDDYIDWRNGDGGFNVNAQLAVSIWLLKGEKR